MALKRSIKEPTAAIFQSWEYLNIAVDAHISGDFQRAATYFEKSNIPEVWEWVNPCWTQPQNNIINNYPDHKLIISKEFRDPDRNISKSVRSAVLFRDGYKCRYCGIPVVSADIRKIAHKLYPASVPWHHHAVLQQHAGFQCFWLQFDHVDPHSHGGLSSPDNVVLSCAVCNFGKDKYTLRQLGLADPRLRSPIPVEWDGLERLRPKAAITSIVDCPSPTP